MFYNVCVWLIGGCQYFHQESWVQCARTCFLLTLCSAEMKWWANLRGLVSKTLPLFCCYFCGCCISHACLRLCSQALVSTRRHSWYVGAEFSHRSNPQALSCTSWCVKRFVNVYFIVCRSILRRIQEPKSGDYIFYLFT